MSIPVDHNKESWSGFFKNEEEAQKALEQMCKKLNEKGKKILTAKKELIERKQDSELIYKLKENQKSTNSITKDLLLYKFVIITA